MQTARAAWACRAVDIHDLLDPRQMRRQDAPVSAPLSSSRRPQIGLGGFFLYVGRGFGLNGSVTGRRSGLRRLRREHNRGEDEAIVGGPSLRLTTQGEQVLGRHPMLARNLGADRARRQCLHQDPGLLFSGPAPARNRPSDHLQSPHRRANTSAAAQAGRSSGLRPANTVGIISLTVG
jgi:hypothetical protein